MDEQPVCYMDSGGARRPAVRLRVSIDPRLRHSSHVHLFGILVVRGTLWGFILTDVSEYKTSHFMFVPAVVSLSKTLNLHLLTWLSVTSDPPAEMSGAMFVSDGLGGTENAWLPLKDSQMGNFLMMCFLKTCWFSYINTFNYYRKIKLSQVNFSHMKQIWKIR